MNRYRLMFKLPQGGSTDIYLNALDFWNALYSAEMFVLDALHRARKGTSEEGRSARVMFAPRHPEGDISIILLDNGDTALIGTIREQAEGGYREIHDPYDSARFHEEYLHDLADEDYQEDDEE